MRMTFIFLCLLSSLCADRASGGSWNGCKQPDFCSRSHQPDGLSSHSFKMTCSYSGWAGTLDGTFGAAGCDCELKGDDYDEQCKRCMCDNGVQGAWGKRLCFDADSSIAKKWPERLQNCGLCKPGYRLVEYASDSYNTWKLCTSNLKCRASAFNTTGNCRGAGFEEYDTSKHDLRCSTANCSAKECCLATCSTGLFNNDSQCQTIEGWVRFDSSKNETMCSSGACAPEDCCFPKCRYG